jgi:uncharacterized RDD family membrane protein YckC
MSDALTPEPAPAVPAAAPAPASAAPAAPAADFVYADVPNRAIAYIIDAIIVAIGVVILGSVLAAIGVGITSYVGALILGVLGLAVSAAYFVYTWTKRRATIGMSALNMQVGNAVDGTTLTTDQAIRRWLAISAPSILAQALQPLPVIGFVLALASLAWFIFLVYSTAKSPTKQGWHDVFANTMVVKAARRVG